MLARVMHGADQQRQPHRCQCPLPQVTRRFTIADKAPVLSGNGAGVPALRQVIDRTAGNGVALKDGPLDGRDAAMTRQ